MSSLRFTGNLAYVVNLGESGYGSGYGYGDGHWDGSGYGYGDGYWDGYRDGYGYGYSETDWAKAGAEVIE